MPAQTAAVDPQIHAMQMIAAARKAAEKARIAAHSAALAGLLADGPDARRTIDLRRAAEAMETAAREFRNASRVGPPTYLANR